MKAMKIIFIFATVISFELCAFAEDVKKYNEKGKLFYSKDSEGNETWYSYHLNGTLAMLHSRDKSGSEKWYSYDSKGKELHVRYSNGIESWNEYDGRGNLINCRISTGYSEWYSYDENDRVILYKNVFGDDIIYDYDSHGNQYRKDKREDYWTASKPVEMVVLTDDGLPLPYRKSPVDGETLGNFKNETLVYATKRTAEKYESDGLINYWYFVHSISDSEKQGWVFGAYVE